MPNLLLDEKIDSGRVAARPVEAGDETNSNRIFGDVEDDRDRRGCGFGRKRSGRAAGCGDHRHTAADQVGYQRPQAIRLVIHPVVLDPCWSGRE